MTYIQENTILMILKLMKILKDKAILTDQEIVEVIKECPEVFSEYEKILTENRDKKQNLPEGVD
jgi:hypothetical protein